MSIYNVIWFRHGLRLHDNPALLEALMKTNSVEEVHLIPIYIFDGETSGTRNCGYNRMKFLLESLEDLNEQLTKIFGRGLILCRGSPTVIFQKLWEVFHITKICYEQDCEPLWHERDEAVEFLCMELGIECIEKVSHTLWNPNEVCATNGNIPPLTYQMFLHIADVLGPPLRPVGNPNFDGISLVDISEELGNNLNIMEHPTPEDFNLSTEDINRNVSIKWYGGERSALESLKARLKVEEEAFRNHFYLPNHANPDLLGPPTSLSAALRFGCLSVRRFYWSVHDLFNTIQKDAFIRSPCGPHITTQLIWREYFYTMSVGNPYFAEMKRNPICLNISWYEDKDDMLTKWKTGKTGFSLIDAAMRQLLSEGWIHHTLRNAVSTFLTRGGLWLNWELGVEHFLRYLLDADWSVCAGNWMWVSSSAFEKLLDSSKCTSPISLAKRLDPNGDYIKRYVPELRNLPTEYLFEPHKTPLELQKELGCVIGEDYPEPIIDLQTATERNTNAMQLIRDSLMETSSEIPQKHCRPSNDDEILEFFWFTEDSSQQLRL